MSHDMRKCQFDVYYPNLELKNHHLSYFVGFFANSMDNGYIFGDLNTVWTTSGIFLFKYYFLVQMEKDVHVNFVYFVFPYEKQNLLRGIKLNKKKGRHIVNDPVINSNSSQALFWRLLLSGFHVLCPYYSFSSSYLRLHRSPRNRNRTSPLNSLF